MIPEETFGALLIESPKGRDRRQGWCRGRESNPHVLSANGF